MNKVHKIAELFQLIEMVKSAATVHLGKMHKLTELDQPVITIKMIQTVHVNKVHKVARLVQLLKIVKQADLLQQDKMYKKAWSFQLVKITKLAETLRALLSCLFWFYTTSKLFRLLDYAWVLLFARSPGFTLCFPLPHVYHKLVTQ